MADYRKNDTTGWDAEQVRRSARPSSGSSSGSSTGSGRREYREPPREPQELPRRKRRRRRATVGGILLYVVGVVMASAILAGVGWLLANDLCAFNKTPKTVVMEVSAQDDFASMATRLKDEGLVEYKWFFKLFGSFAKADEKIKEGIYELNTDMDYRALIAAMSTGSESVSTEVVTVTIPEGYTVSQVISLLGKNNVSTADALTEAAKNATFDFTFIDNDNLGSISRLEGYLFPDTYDFYVGEKASSALNRLLKNFYNKMDQEMMEKVTASGRSLSDIVIIASLIEKETDGTDQATIASVIYNRLAGGGGTYGLLQIDAALLYDLPSHTGGITNADKETNSPYNLYKKEGLPPTPIANPGLASLQAAVSPESTKYYYYALATDGKHRFFKTYDEHLNFLNSKDYKGS